MRRIRGGAYGVAWRRGRLGFVVPLVLVLVVLVEPGVARASGTLDQAQTDTSGGLLAITGPDNTVGTFSEAQTFTAGLTGGLNRVDLYLGNLGATGQLMVQITNTSGSVPGLGGLPGSTVLASASVPASSIPHQATWVPVTFASPAPVTSGTQYAIVAFTLDTDANSTYVSGYSFSLSSTPPYNGGTLWASFTSPPMTWQGEADQDLAFKTYVPTTAVLTAQQLVIDSSGPPPLAPGTALADKAFALQAAVDANPQQTAAACAGIADFLGLVHAQSGKKLTTGPTGTATELTSDANNLATALGCA